jgi:hypothetical protein
MGKHPRTTVARPVLADYTEGSPENPALPDPEVNMRYRFETVSECTCIGLLLLLPALAVAAGVPADEKVAPGDDASAESAATGSPAGTGQDVVDEIVVYGDKPLFSLRREVVRTEAQFWDVFSALNPDDEFDVRCFYEVPSFTHIRRHVCRAKFVVDAMNADAKFLFSEEVGRFRRPAALAIERKKKEMQLLMEQMIVEHPELQAALARFSTAKSVLEAEKARRYGKPDQADDNP